MKVNNGLTIVGGGDFLKPIYKCIMQESITVPSSSASRGINYAHSRRSPDDIKPLNQSGVLKPVCVASSEVRWQDAYLLGAALLPYEASQLLRGYIRRPGVGLSVKGFDFRV